MWIGNDRIWRNIMSAYCTFCLISSPVPHSQCLLLMSSYKIPQWRHQLATNRLFDSDILKLRKEEDNYSHIFKSYHEAEIKKTPHIHKHLPKSSYSNSLRDRRSLKSMFSFYVPFNDPNENNGIDTDTVYCDVTQISVEAEHKLIPNDFVEIILLN